MPDKKIFYPLLDIENVLPILNKITVFGGLNDAQLFKIFKILEKVEYNQGEYIYRVGSAPSHIYILESGEIKVIVESGQISLEILTLKVGDCFGETSVIGIQPHSSSTIATKKTELIVLERKALLNIYDSDKTLFGLLILNIARETSRHLHKLDKILIDYYLSQKK